LVFDSVNRLAADLDSTKIDYAKTVFATPRAMLVSAKSNPLLSGLVIGLAVALKKKSVSPTIATIGTSLIESTHFRRVSGRLSHSLDLWALNSEQVQLSLARICQGSELVILKGSIGLFDKFDSDYSFESQAEVARKFNFPIILVLDANGYRESIAAIVHGFGAIDPKLKIAGVIVTGIESNQHQQAIKQGIQSLNGPIYLGGLNKEQSELLTQRDNVAPSENLSLLPRSQLMSVAASIQEAIDFEAFSRIAESALAIELSEAKFEKPELDCRIAVADDAAFHLTTQDNLDLIRRAGGSLVAFSPLADHKLPRQVQGVYLSGGYLEGYASDLSENRQMLAALKEFILDGGVVYAEGSGLLCLCSGLTLLDGRSLTMAGAIQGIASLLSQTVVYSEAQMCQLEAIQDTIVANASERFRGFFEQRWLLQPSADTRKCFEIWPRTNQSQVAQQKLSIIEGFSPKANVVATGVQAHWGSNPLMALKFVQSVVNRIKNLQNELPRRNSSV